MDGLNGASPIEGAAATLPDGCSPRFDVVPLAEAARRRVAIADVDGAAAAIFGTRDVTARSWAYLRAPWACGRVHVVAPEVFDRWLAAFEADVRALEPAGGASAAGVQGSTRDSLSLASIDGESNVVVRFVAATLYDALQTGASDVHLEADARGLAVKFRLDGVLARITRIDSRETAEQAVSRIKVLSELDIAERRLPQDGRLSVGFRGRSIDVRVSVMPSVHGEDVVMRILDRQHLARELEGLTLARLGFDAVTVESLKSLCALPYGMVLVTGPTGSGKTTTLYAALSETRDDALKVITIEDPVEYQLDGVLQIPVNEKKGLSFARGLRSILRHDPDRILVGEIRDRETAEIAVQSALTGHLVYTTVHANSAFDVLGRFSQLGLDLHDLTAALNGVLAQRLVRKVCPACAAPRAAEPGRLAELHAAGLEPSVASFARAVGCERCRFTGYRGRIAIGEVLRLTGELKEAIVGRQPARELRALAAGSGMVSLRHRALQRAAEGITTLEEVDRVTLAD
jgi:general secretion pathway protein E